jgi:hypothetical protein
MSDANVATPLINSFILTDKWPVLIGRVATNIKLSLRERILDASKLVAGSYRYGFEARALDRSSALASYVRT